MRRLPRAFLVCKFFVNQNHSSSRFFVKILMLQHGALSFSIKSGVVTICLRISPFKAIHLK